MNQTTSTLAQFDDVGARRIEAVYLTPDVVAQRQQVLQLIAPQIGDIFDAQTMEAMFEAPLPGTKVGTIIQVMTEGFMLHDRLLRAAQVGVSSNTQG
jgi:molecular chaperone GrpE